MADLEQSLHRLQTDYLDLWQIHDVRTSQDLAMISAPGGALEAFVEAKAVHDFHYGSAYDSYPEGSEESAIYQSKLAELANKKGQVQ